MKVRVELTLSDDMSAKATKALQDLVAASEGTGRATKGVGDAAKAAGRAAAQAGKDAARETGRYTQGLKAAQATARAGTSAEKERSAAIDRSAAAHARAAKGAREQMKATREAARAQKELTDSVRRTDGTSLSRLSRSMDALVQKGRALRGGFGSFARNAARGLGQGMLQGMGQRAMTSMQGISLQPAIDYERRLAMMSNTAFADRKTLEGRRAGMQELRAAVDTAVQEGGGSRESAAEALDSMLASGAVQIPDAMRMLPMLQKFASATGASSTDIAGIAIRGIQQGFFRPDQVEEALNSALVAGQEGGFELKDMARWLPQLMASAQGMKSMEGFKTILAAAQASVTTAGDTDQAGNNLVNLLAKLNSRQLSDALLKKNNINLSGTLAAAREKGQLPLEAFMTLLDKEVVGKNKQYQALQAKAATATGADKDQILADMADIIQASAIGEVLADRQAVAALVALMSNPQYLQQVKTAMDNSAGAVDLNYETIQSTFSAKQEQVAQARASALQSSLDKVSPVLGLLADGVTGAANAFPAVTSAATAAAAALGSLAALAGAGYLLRGRASVGRGNAATAGRAVKARRYKRGPAATSAATAAPTATGGSGRAGKFARVGGAAGVAALGLLDAGMVESDASLSREEKNIAHAENVGGTVGALAVGAAGAAGGAKVGALAGTAIGGPIGTAVGGLIGSLIGLAGSMVGYYAGSFFGKKAGEAVFSPSGSGRAMPGNLAAGAASPAMQVFPTTNAFPGLTGPRQMSEIVIPAPEVTNYIRVTIDGREVVTTVEEHLERMSGRGD